MVRLTKKDGVRLTSFGSNNEAHLYATDRENAKLLRGHPEFRQSSKWGFLPLWPKGIAEVIHLMRRGYNEEFFLKAWNKQLPVVEICKGDVQNVRRILVEGNINVNALREDWRKGYFEAHGLHLSEFKSRAQAHLYATDTENAKLLRRHPEFRQSSKWGFAFLLPRRYAEIIHIARRGYNEEFFLNAWEKQVPIVELCEGDIQKTRRIFIEGKISVDALLEDWCKDYFDDHGMRLDPE